MEVHNEEEEIMRQERGLKKEKGLPSTEFTRNEEEYPENYLKELIESRKPQLNNTFNKVDEEMTTEEQEEEIKEDIKNNIRYEGDTEDYDEEEYIQEKYDKGEYDL